MEDKGKYYTFIVNQIKDLKHGYQSVMYDGIKNVLPNYGIHDVDEEEFKFSFEWAVADVFGGGCEVEVQ